ncbi:hypothetical protein [Alteribacillus sp. HJP-4]|uniref:hypothetical protein n=1 Tax=Alteribacillus sp. HJP-4 TaxID=2775394 RepID=UPI0035CD0E51
MDMKATNISGQDVSYYPDQGILVTNTGEQVEVEMMLSGEVGGDFYGKVTKEREACFVQNDDKTDFSSGELIISPPHDMEEWNDLGEETRTAFDIISWD